jgi:CO dehydrogenase maturation factor
MEMIIVFYKEIHVKIAFAGKGGSGKTTLAALFARFLAEAGAPVVAIDADINQHLGVALGLDEAVAASVPALGAHMHGIKEYLRGTNPLIPSAQAMVKTTPPGRGSRLLRVMGDDPIHEHLSRDVNGVRLMVTGPFDEADLGVACYHSKSGAAELYLSHLVDHDEEYVVVDLTAGADSFASGMFTRFDLTFLVVEPTRRGVAVYRQYRDRAAGYQLALAVVGNKITGPEDVAFLRAELGDVLVGCFGHSGYVRAMEQGRRPFRSDGAGGPGGLHGLEPANRDVLATLRAAVDARVKDWDLYQRHAVEFHLKNARARGTAELESQIDPEFTHAH